MSCVILNSSYTFQLVPKYICEGIGGWTYPHRCKLILHRLLKWVGLLCGMSKRDLDGVGLDQHLGVKSSRGSSLKCPHAYTHSVRKGCELQYSCLSYTTIITRNTHAHLCLVPVRRLCARVIYAGAGEMTFRMTFLSVTHTYVRTYILCENRSSLMRSAIRYPLPTLYHLLW